MELKGRNSVTVWSNVRLVLCWFAWTSHLLDNYNCL